MNDSQKSKRKFRQTKRWKEFKQKMKTEAGKVDAITGKKLYRSWQLHHQNLNEKEYQNLRPEWFLCVNNLTHKVIHWLYVYYVKDPAIIDRLKAEMLKMKEINGGRNGD